MSEKKDILVGQKDAKGQFVVGNKMAVGKGRPQGALSYDGANFYSKKNSQLRAFFLSEFYKELAPHWNSILQKVIEDSETDPKARLFLLQYLVPKPKEAEHDKVMDGEPTNVPGLAQHFNDVMKAIVEATGVQIKEVKEVKEDEVI